MKKIKYIFSLLLLILCLVSCNKGNNSTDTGSSDNEDIQSYETSNISQDENQKEHLVNLRKNEVDETNSKSITFDTSNYFSTSYNTGSFGELDGFEYYRCYHENYKIMTKLLKTPTYLEGELNSSIYNVNNLKGIYEVDITYKSEKGFNLYYSFDRSYSNTYTFGSTSQMFDLTIKLDYSGFFKIETLGEEVFIESLTVKYNNSVTNNNDGYLSYSDTRVDVPYTSFDPESGETRTIADNITINNDNTYTINSSKSYTYYTIDDITKNPALAEKACYTDPIDVANYYTLFNAFPLNYGYKSETSLLQKYFGNNVRCVSKYSRTDGYATSVPYYASSYYPTYYELDIDEDGSYTTSGRGKGRLVIWEEGFKNVSYSGQAVIVYTDDHYATFREYNNYGTFGTRFNAERKVTGLKWSEPVTLSAK